METIGQNATSGRKARAIQFIELETGCYIPLNFKLNGDGYFRKRWGSSRTGLTDFEMFHRFIWRARVGEIPDEFEINHLCGNRACQNVAHLECIHGTEHAIKTNRERYRQVQAVAKLMWETTGCTPTELADKFGARAFGWVRKWKREAYE